MRSLCKIFGCSVMPSASSLDCSAVLKSGRQKRVKIGFMVASLCFALSSLFFSPSSVSALGTTAYINIGNFSIKNYKWHSGANTSGVCSTPSQGSIVCTFDSAITIEGLEINTYQDIPSNSRVSLNIAISGQNAYDTQFVGFSADSGWMIENQQVYHNAYGTWQTIAVHLDLVYGDYGKRAFINLTPRAHGREFTLTPGSELWVQPGTYGEMLDGSWVVESITDVRTKLGNINTVLNEIKSGGITATVDQSGVISAVNQGAQQQVAATNANTQAVNNAASQAHSDAQAQTDATNAQTEQQKNQYEQDKQEEANREEQGNDDAVKASGIFNFKLANPFESIFSLFLSSSTCANIPVLASWVHSDTSTVCSWWPQNVRNVLTPVFGIASMMLLFGFLMRWLGGSKTIHFGGD